MCDVQTNFVNIFSSWIPKKDNRCESSGTHLPSIKHWSVNTTFVTQTIVRRIIYQLTSTHVGIDRSHSLGRPFKFQLCLHTRYLTWRWQTIGPIFDDEPVSGLDWSELYWLYVFIFFLSLGKHLEFVSLSTYT